MKREEPVLPDQTSDDTDVGWGDEPDDRDEEMRRDVPPHHLDRD